MSYRVIAALDQAVEAATVLGSTVPSPLAGNVSVSFGPPKEVLVPWAEWTALVEAVREELGEQP